MQESKTLNDAIAELREYIRKDRIVRENREESDFEKFCEGHCRDIELVLDSFELLRGIANERSL